jgi:opacity protein-like surface antigen
MVFWFGLSSSNELGWRNDVPSDVTVDSWGLYVKPMYPVTDAFDIYALLGYGATDVEFDLDGGGSISTDADGFSWGLGASYAFTDNVAMFIDYTSVIDGEDATIGGEDYELSTDTVNFGVNYQF